MHKNIAVFVHSRCIIVCNTYQSIKEHMKINITFFSTTLKIFKIYCFTLINVLLIIYFNVIGFRKTIDYLMKLKKTQRETGIVINKVL